MRFLKDFVLAMVALMSLATVANAQTVCPQCGRIHGSSQPMTSNYQGLAQAEAQVMASRGYKGHTQGNVAGVGFCGVGWSSSGTPNTCTPSSAMTLVADATARGADGWYRVRYWR